MNSYRLLIILCSISLLTVSCRRQASSKTEEADRTQIETQITFVGATEYNFGEFCMPDTLEHYFVYKNIGHAPFVINKVEVSCHCVRTAFNKKPLAPGFIDSILVVYTGNGYKPGYFFKTCTIHGNTEAPQQLKIEGVCVKRLM